MTIEKIIENQTATLLITGRIDTTTAPELDAALEGIISSGNDLIFDFNNVEYVSSAGLRVLLKAQKAMNNVGKMKLIGVNECVMEVFDVTGFSDILTIE